MGMQAIEVVRELEVTSGRRTDLRTVSGSSSSSGGRGVHLIGMMLQLLEELEVRVQLMGRVVVRRVMMAVERGLGMRRRRLLLWLLLVRMVVIGLRERSFAGSGCRSREL